MRKLVFSGVINGKEFDNVQEYNKEMSKLIASGSSKINASSSTRLVNEPEDEKVRDLDAKRETPIAREKVEFNPEDYIPFFNNESNQYYLDLLVSGDADLNEKNQVVAEDIFKEKYKALKDVLDNGDVTLEDAFGFVNILKEIRSRISSDATDNKNATTELTEKISEDTARLGLLHNAAPVISIVGEYYDAAFELVKNYLLNL